MEKQETALQWLLKFIENKSEPEIQAVIKEALELEREQIEYAFWEGTQSVYIEYEGVCTYECGRTMVLCMPKCSSDPLSEADVFGADKQYFNDNYITDYQL